MTGKHRDDPKGNPPFGGERHYQQDAEIALEIREILNYDPDELCGLTEKLCRTHGVKLKLFLKGFSQRSYDRLGAGGFEETLKRAEEVMEGIRKSQVDCEIEIVYLLYQFNMCEVHCGSSICTREKDRILLQVCSL